MKTTSLLQTLVLSGILFSLTSCFKDDVDIEHFHYTYDEYAIISKNLDLPRDLLSYRVSFPKHLTNRGVQQPQIRDEKATLGRVLFYDNKLSQNEKVSCASCHKQELAFSDDVAFSEGFAGELTKRNSLPLASAANFESSYNGQSFSPDVLFFWDERAGSIEEQCVETIQDQIEMGMDLWDLSERLSQEPYYQILFRKAYGTEAVNPDRITEALAEFVNSIVSTSSRFDEGMNRHNNSFVDFSNFSAAENLGKSLFNQNCNGCHGNDMSTAMEAVANNGLDYEYEDRGVGSVTNYSFDNGKFKVPFLRNVALTAPYMHDGRFKTLEEVVEHYSTGVKEHDNLDLRLREGFSPTGSPVQFNFSEEEKAALVAFLNTVTDDDFVHQEKYADPFK